MALNRRKLLKYGGLAGVAALGVAAYKLSGPGGSIVEGKSRAAPFAGDTTLPPAADVVIVGGGIVGVCAALYLAEKGVDVVLCEKGAIAGEASGRAQGQVSSAGLDPGKLDLIALSKSLWAGMNEAVGGETGYRVNGLVIPFLEKSGADDWEGWLSAASSKATNARLLSGAQANAMLPSATPWAGAFYDPSDGGTEPVLATPVIAEGARKRGAKIYIDCAVRGFETTAGKISGVVTEKGTIRTGTVIVAGGCWSSKLLESFGVRFPTANMFSSLARVRLEHAPEAFPGNFEVPAAIARRHIDGTYSFGATSGRIPVTPALISNLWAFRDVILNPPWDVEPHLGSYFFSELFSGRHWDLDEISPFEKNRVLQPSINEPLLDKIVTNMRKAFPAIGKVDIVERWGGALTVTPDNIPVLSAVPARPGLFMAAGFTYGITMGPAAGKLIAQLVTNETPSVDLKYYRYSRFVDGSKLTFTH